MPITLTFDDGPGPSTPALLDVLGAASQRATFFVLGSHLSTSLAMAVRIVREGHCLGNHTFGHARAGGISNQALIDEIATTDRLIHRAYRHAGVVAPDILPLRLPYGVSPADPRVDVLAGLRRKHTGWTFMLDDWRRPPPSPSALAEAMRRHAEVCAERGRDPMFCLHDGSRYAEARPNTVEAVRLFLNQSR
ncbi:polysaccharide deacetylase family protein [Chitinasiproducens palmae]|nr:polysaccharide deacetylase family protein [Chitinasiproducens palmae]